MANHKSSTLTKEEMNQWLGYIIGGQVPTDEETTKELKAISSRKVTVGDASAIASALNEVQRGYITTLQEQVTVLQKVLLANKVISEDDIKEGIKEYEAELEEQYKAVMQALESGDEDALKKAMGGAK